jgi:hypothetical protein
MCASVVSVGRVIFAESFYAVRCKVRSSGLAAGWRIVVFGSGGERLSFVDVNGCAMGFRQECIDLVTLRVEPEGMSMQVAVMDAVYDIQGIVARVGNIEPA